MGGRSSFSCFSWPWSLSRPDGRRGWCCGANPEKAPGPEGRRPDRSAQRRPGGVEGESQACVQCDAWVHQGDPPGRRGPPPRGGARGYPRVSKLPGKKEAETEILVRVVC